MIDVNSVMLCYQLLTRRLTHFSLSHSDVLLLSPLLFTQTYLSDTRVYGVMMLKIRAVHVFHRVLTTPWSVHER